MNIYVVGGAGYVGGWLTDKLIELNHDVTVVDNLLYEDMYIKEVRFINESILNSEKLLNLTKNADLVIWLAALVGDPACAINESLAMEVNYLSVEKFVTEFKGKFIFLSTCSVYGANNSILDENSELKPLSVYAKSKILAEEAIKKALGQNSIIFRLGTLYGIADTYSRLRSDLVLNTLTIKAHFSGTISIFGGEQWRPLLHVRDVSTAIVSTLSNFIPGTYNLHENNYQILDIANYVKDHFPDLEIKTTDISFQDLRNYRVSSRKAEETFGFLPQYNINEGISSLKKVLREGRIPNPDIPRFQNGLYLKESKGTRV